MANRVTISPELAAVVAAAREAAAEAGELRPAPTHAPAPVLSPEVRAAVADWRSSGDYDRTVAEIVAGDPDLATE